MLGFKSLIKSFQNSYFTLFFFITLLLFNTLFELTSVAIIVPVLKILLTDEQIISYQFKFFGNEINFYFSQKKYILILLAVLFFFLIKSLFLIFFSHWKTKFIFLNNTILSSRLFSNYLYQSYLFYLVRNSSENIRNIIMVQNFTRNLDQLAIFFTELLVLIGFFIILIFYNFEATIYITTLIAIFGIIFSKVVSKKIKQIGKKNHNANEIILTILKESFVGIKEIKIAGKEKFFIKNFSRAIDKFSSSMRLHEFLQSLPKILIELIIVISVVLSFYILVSLNTEKNEIFIFLALFSAIGFKLVPSINKILNSYNHLKYYWPLTKVISDDLKLSNNLALTTDINLSFKKKIEIKNLSFSYKKNKQILKNINLEINKNNIVGIIGRSGTGKTTLVNIILGLLKPQSKTICTVDGVNVSFQSKNWQKKIGYVPQSTFIFNKSIEENIALGVNKTAIIKKKLLNCIKLAQLDDFINKLPEGLNTVLGENGKSLSGGQIQRIGIARSLYSEPEILIMDEPTSSLDEKTEDKFLLALHKIKKNKTIILISHTKKIIKFCEKIYLIKNRKLKFQK